MLVAASQRTAKQFLEQWIEDVYKPAVKPLTYVNARSAIHHHLIPAFGHVALQKLTPEMIQAFYRQKLDEGMKASSVVRIHAVLHRALEDVVKQGLVVRNVAKLVTLPRTDRHEMQVLTVEQAERLLEVARGSSLDTLLVVALTTGMRLGELLALRWDDVDFEHSTLFVRRTVARVSTYGHIEGESKTRASGRRIVLPAVASEALKEHWTQQEQIRATAGEKWQEKRLVFADKNGGFLELTKVRRWFNKLLKQADLSHIRFHDLRHSAAMILLVAGVHPKVVQERSGHSNISMTLDIYSHVLPSMQQEVANKIDGLFKKP